MNIEISFEPTVAFDPVIFDKNIKTFKVSTTSGRTYYCNADYCYNAVIRIQNLGEVVTAWTRSPLVPVNTTIHQ